MQENYKTPELGVDSKNTNLKKFGGYQEYFIIADTIWVKNRITSRASVHSLDNKALSVTSSLKFLWRIVLLSYVICIQILARYCPTLISTTQHAQSIHLFYANFISHHSLPSGSRLGHSVCVCVCVCVFNRKP